MYQIKDKKERIIIARFINKEDAKKFLSIKIAEERERYEMTETGMRTGDESK